MRVHLFPSRTQKLSSCTPTILGGRLPGKIGNANTKPHYCRSEVFLCHCAPVTDVTGVAIFYDYPRHCEERSDVAISQRNPTGREPVDPPVSCCGARQKLRLTKQACFLLTAATHSTPFFRHRRQSPRSPSRTQKLSSCTLTILGGRLTARQKTLAFFGTKAYNCKK